jgi:hypothetical protein
MKKIILAIALISTLPVVAIAEQNANTAKAAPKEHHMQNANPSSTGEALQQTPEQVPEHVMKNTDTSSKPEPKKMAEHHMKNN